tara:strand:+ start:25 stop:651 length:627 start_codon:yes stop_codon:yes gene_type:complete
MASGTKTPKHSGEVLSYRYDSRSDLGYGRTSNRLHKPRSAGSEFPYIEKPSDEDSSWEDEETGQEIRKKVINPTKSDPFSYKGVNPFYFASGNVKLSDCFFRTDEVIEEVLSLEASLVPMPNLYKNKVRSGVGAAVSQGAISQKSFQRTGSKRGFASPPPHLNDLKNDNDDDDLIFNLEDLVDKIDHESGNFRVQRSYLVNRQGSKYE